MAANDELPRGWTLAANVGTGAALNLVLPATTGIIHVLDSFYVRFANNLAAAANSNDLFLSSSDGVFNNLVLSHLWVSSAVTGAFDSDNDNDLNLAAGPGASLTVSAPGVPGYVWVARIKGHDL